MLGKSKAEGRTDWCSSMHDLLPPAETEHPGPAQGMATVGGVRFSQQENPLLRKETEIYFPPVNQAYSVHLSHFIYPGERAVNTEQRREAHRHKLAAALLLLPLVSSFRSPASPWAGAARPFSPLPNWNLIHTQPRASGRLSCGCSSPAFSCHNIDTKQNNSDGETLPGSGRQTGKETGSSRLHYCVGQAAARAASKLCSLASLLLIRGGCGMRAEGDISSTAHSPC